jgi:Bacteriophage HK97-gp10, putative tail-component
MGVQIKGMPQLQSRFNAIKPTPGFMAKLGATAIAEQKRLVPRKTGNLARSIGLGSITARSVQTVATANYAAFVEFGTRAHEIVPKRAKALRFAVGGNARLSGTPRSGAPVIFAKRVRHPGTRAKPFMVPGATEAVNKLGPEFIVRQWNGAA